MQEITLFLSIAYNMKIVFLSDDFPPTSFGGAGISTYELALGMKKAGHEVFVITTCRNLAEVGSREQDGLIVYRILSNYSPRWRMWRSLYNPSALREVKQILRELQPNVVHINNVHYHLSYYVFVLARRYAQATVFTARDAMSFSFGKLSTHRYLNTLDPKVTIREHILQAGRRFNPFYNLSVKSFLSLADRRLAVSNSLQQALLKNGIQDVRVLHTGIAPAQWQVSEDKIVAFQKKHNLEGKKIILFSGRLSNGKGGNVLLQAFAHICESIPNARLLIAGTNDGFLERVVTELSISGLEEKVVFTGWIDRDDIPVVYAVADVVVVPSLCLDAFPRVVLEAMATGKPVAGTCFGGASEVIEGGVTGCVINPLSVGDISMKVIDLLKNPEKCKRFGEAGYQRIMRDFNLEDKVKEYIVVYESVVKETV